MAFGIIEFDWNAYAENIEEAFLALAEYYYKLSTVPYRKKIAERIVELSNILDEEELNQISTESLKGLIKFLESAEIKQPFLAATGQGNIKATWIPGGENRLAIEFIDKKNIKFVLFCSDDSENIARLSGLERNDTFLQKMSNYDLRWIYNNGEDSDE